MNQLIKDGKFIKKINFISAGEINNILKKLKERNFIIMLFN